MGSSEFVPKRMLLILFAEKSQVWGTSFAQEVFLFFKSQY